MASHLRGPLLYGNSGHPFDGLPLQLVDQIGPKGNGGLYYEFYHFDAIDVATLATVTTGRWVITETTTGAISILDLGSGAARGVLRLQCDTNAGDNVNAYVQSKAFRYVVGKRLWFAIRCRLEDLDQDAMIAGLAIEGTTDFIATAPTDGIYFHKAGTDTDLDFVVRKDATETDSTNRGGTLVNDQWMVLGFYVDSLGAIHPFQGQNGAALAVSASPVLTNVPDDENLTITFGVETADGGGDYMDVDWVFAAQEV